MADGSAANRPPSSYKTPSSSFHARSTSARGNRNRALSAAKKPSADDLRANLQKNDDTLSSLNVRVKEREPEERPRSRLSSLFGNKDSPGAAGIRPIADGKSDLKETLTRPLSSLFRRSQAQSGSNTSANTMSYKESNVQSQTQSVVFGAQDHSVNDRPMTGYQPIRQAELSEQAAIAPHLNRMSTLHPAEPLYIKNINLSKMNDIDVSFLARFLCPEDEVGDEDIPWNWDYLYASVSSELREEWLLEEEANDEMYRAGDMNPNGGAVHAYSPTDF
ncbi:intraflagellar transport protein 43 domain-containing protein [Ditylenchus destructor]|uniref:Intraflagellar transport protein 43 domain-containing protein n=1 Tax=Ditylenchus destructor TaxID=166010 RepID=A0AAD4MRL3_9BILA|nr:intraflagellar transport protein 43 domain-containing protein [Ditylenchus destructor]